MKKMESSMHWLWKCVSLVVFMLIFSGGTVWAQATAEISGTVRDQTGALLPGVEVTATQTNTGTARMTLTNETGSYVLSNLAIGPYEFEVALPGFRTYVQTGILLQVNSSPVINIALEVGQVTQTIQVQANATLVETRNIGIGTVVENQRIVELPLNGRQVTDLILLAGGAVDEGVAAPYAPRGAVRLSVAGGVAEGYYGSVGYVLDGALHNDVWFNLNLPFPFPDALEEFQVETSALSARSGMHSGSAINAVTKSGTNAFHGTLFEFVRNGKFNARNFFASKRDTLKRNQFGAILGGPIQSNKLFFFAGYQGTTLRSDPSTTQNFIPTAKMLSGDFTDYAAPACNAAGQLTLGAPFVDNRIDPAEFSPAALNIASRLPTTSDPCGKILFGIADRPNEHQFIGRLDYQLNDRQSVFGRYMATTDDKPAAFSVTPDNVLVTGPRGFAGGKDSLVQAFTLGHTYLIGSNMVNALRLTANRTAIHQTAVPFFDANDVGIDNFFPYSDGWMRLSVAGGFELGSSGDGDVLWRTAAFQLNEELSFTRGNHQMSFGGTGAQWQISHLPNKHTFSSGLWNFRGSVTGRGLSDFMTGNLFFFLQSAPFEMTTHQWYLSLHGQDTWQATPRLTLSYGLRWEPYFPLENRNGRINHFDFDRFRAGTRTSQLDFAPAGLTYPGDPGFPRRAGMDDQWAQFAPRVGVAWDVNGDGRTSVRAAYGESFELIMGGFHLGTTIVPPWAGRIQIIFPPGGLDDPWRDFEGGNPFPIDPVNGLFTPSALNATFDYDTEPTRVQQWNLSIQRQIVSDWLLSTSYLGAHTIHLWVADEANPASLAPGASRSNVEQRRLLFVENPEEGKFFSNLFTIDDGGTRSYHALQLSLQRTVSSGVSVNGNYTWSHCVGDKPTAAVNPGRSYVDPNNRDLDRGNCGTDRRHLFNWSAVMDTPEFANPTLRAVASDWKLSLIYRWSSGAPLTALSGRDTALKRCQRPKARSGA